MSEAPHYEINVSRCGRHYFATAPRSLRNAVDARMVYRDLRARFHESEGFEISVTHWPGEGKVMDLAKWNA